MIMTTRSFQVNTELFLKPSSNSIIPDLQKSSLNPSTQPFVQVPLTLSHVWFSRQFPHVMAQFCPKVPCKQAKKHESLVIYWKNQNNNKTLKIISSNRIKSITLWKLSFEFSRITRWFVMMYHKKRKAARTNSYILYYNFLNLNKSFERQYLWYDLYQILRTCICWDFNGKNIKD